MSAYRTSAKPAKYRSSKPRQWWMSKPDDAHGTIAKTTKAIGEQSTQRWEAWRAFDRVYGDPWWAAADGPATPFAVTGRGRQFRVNRVRLHVETYCSRMAKTRVLPMALVKGGDHDLKVRVKLHNRLVEGAFEELGVFDMDLEWCRDVARYGAGWSYVDEDGEEPVILRCDPYSVLIDQHEWSEGQGRTIHWCRPRPKYDLINEFPEHAEAIQRATGDDAMMHVLRNTRADQQAEMVPVYYSWARTIGDQVGRKVVSVQGATLSDEEYDEEDLPFAWVSRTPSSVRPWGEPLMADLAPVQMAMDRYMHRVDESLWLANVTRLLLRKGGKINKKKLVNLPATLLEVENLDDIKSFNWEISPQLMQFVEFQLRTMQELSRSSQLATTGESQKNIRSYAALKLAEDTDVEGLREALRSRDSFYVRMARLLIKAFERLGSYKMMVKVGKSAESISYRKVKLPRGSYVWTVMPTNFLHKTVEGRMDQAEWLVDHGLLPQDQIAHFIDFPDLESETAMAMAQYDAIMHRIDRILVDGEYSPPHSLLNLTLLRKLVGDAVARAETDGVPEEKIQMLRDLAAQAEAIEKKQLGVPAQPPAAPAPPGPPVGAMQPPVPPMTETPPPAPPVPQV